MLQFQDIGDDSMLQQMKQELDNKTRVKDPHKKFRCLVVIDSPVNSTTWLKNEKQILEMVGEGSKILRSVTLSWHEEKIKQGTENSVEETHGTIELRTMNEANSKTLFNHIYDRGMRRGTGYKVDEMNHIRNCILKITNGLPLAVVLVAKLMRTMDFGKWEAAAAYLQCNSEDNKLKTILSVCIDDLSDELKSCLLYTAGFPENRPIDARHLVRLWMAEGFLTRQHKLETEELGQCYLKELIYRGLLQLLDKTTAHGGFVQWVAIPDQIHPLLKSEAQRTSFMDVHYGGSLPPPGNTRRLALHNYNDKFPALDNCLDKLRTVVSYSDEYTDYPNGPKLENSTKNEPELGMREFLQGSPYLRVINLEGIKVVEEKKRGDAVCALPDEIGEMVHLQYLGARSRLLKKLPSSVGNLGNLQTIDVRGTDVKKLPKSLWKIKTLRHVLGDELALPRSTGDLKLMHTLESVTIGQVKRGKKLRLRFLHRLHVAELDVAEQGEALKSVLEGLSSLEALILSGKHIPVDLFAPEAGIALCLKHVEYLKLDGQLHYSSLDSCLVNLTHLVLRSTKIGQDFIHWIGKQPVLAELELLECSYEHDKVIIICADGFNCLTRLKISGQDILKEIHVPGDTATRTPSIDVPKPDEVVKIDNKHCSHCMQPPPEQQPAGTAGSDDLQQPNGGQEDQVNHGHINTEPHEGTTTTTNHGHGGNYQQTEEDGNPSPTDPLTEIILEAVKNKNESTKNDIAKYIKKKTKGDSLDIALQYMVQQSHKLIAEPQPKRSDYFKYSLKQA